MRCVFFIQCADHNRKGNTQVEMILKKHYHGNSHMSVSLIIFETGHDICSCIKIEE